jgi:hypothetical protein
MLAVRAAAAVLALVAVSVAWSVGLAAAGTKPTGMPKLYECQHPTTTGQEAYHLRHISPKAACKVVRKLAAYLQKDHHRSRLYRCNRPHPNGAGTPVLKQHRFDGYMLRISKKFGLVGSRGKSSFAVTGTDFPLNCS